MLQHNRRRNSTVRVSARLVYARVRVFFFSNASHVVRIFRCRFPFHNNRLLATWIKATRRSNWVPVSTSRICDKHFGINDHLLGSRMKPLKKAARPVINNANAVRIIIKY